MDIHKPITFQITSQGRFRRQNLRYDGSSVELASYRLEGRVLNLSLTGLAIETPNRILVGAEYSLRLACGGLAADVVGRVQWCRMKGTRGATNGDVHPIFHAGIAIVRHQDDALDRLVDRLQAPEMAVAASTLAPADDDLLPSEALTNLA